MAAPLILWVIDDSYLEKGEGFVEVGPTLQPEPPGVGQVVSGELGPEQNFGHVAALADGALVIKRHRQIFHIRILVGEAI